MEPRAAWRFNISTHNLKAYSNIAPSVTMRVNPGLTINDYKPYSHNANENPDSCDVSQFNLYNYLSVGISINKANACTLKNK